MGGQECDVPVDGKITRYWRMNKSFMAVPIIQGPHLLSVQYEPHTWLRWGLFTALIAALVSFFGVFLAALRSEDKQR